MTEDAFRQISRRKVCFLWGSGLSCKLSKKGDREGNISWLKMTIFYLIFFFSFMDRSLWELVHTMETMAPLCALQCACSEALPCVHGCLRKATALSPPVNPKNLELPGYEVWVVTLLIVLGSPDPETKVQTRKHNGNEQIFRIHKCLL